jgi:hypothetical protein
MYALLESAQMLSVLEIHLSFNHFVIVFDDLISRLNVIILYNHKSVKKQVYLISYCIAR